MADVAVRQISIPQPSAPHDPWDRVLLDVIDGWQVRVPEPGGACARYFGQAGFGHLQLWHPSTGLSLLSPSEITNYRFEFCTLANWKFSHEDYLVIREMVHQALHVDLPRPFFVETLMEVFIESARETINDRKIIHAKSAMETI